MPSVDIRLLNESEVLFETQEPIYSFDSFFSVNFGGLTDGKKIISKSDYASKYHLLRRFFIENGDSVGVTVESELQAFISELSDFKSLKAIEPLSDDEVLDKLSKESFKRKLKHFQLRNLKKLCSLPHGANFSVPGGGKTTDAIGFYAFKKTDKSKLLVVSPINAYLAWEEDLQNCLGENSDIINLRGNISELELQLNKKGEFYWTNYDSFLYENKRKLLEKFLIENEVIMILDESHRAKGEKISEALLKTSIYPKHKLILTGTPMPHSSSDLEAQFSFLYPRHDIGLPDQFIKEFQPFYVRTSDKDLNLKELKISYHPVNIYDNHLAFYKDYIDSKIKKGERLAEILDAKDIKSAYMRYIRFMAHPGHESIQNLIYDIDPSLADGIASEGNQGFEGDGAKMDAVVNRAKQLIEEGEKVLIWSSFVDSVERLAERLSPYGSSFIHGGVKSDGSKIEDYEDNYDESDWPEEEQESRERIIKNFKENPSSMVLVANPAAAAESMSLHTVCNYALYLDRTYNAGHYLQSQKRIHRLTEGKEFQKNIEIFYANVRASIDIIIEDTLTKRCHAMHEFLNESEITEKWVGTSNDLYWGNLGYDYKDYDQKFDDNFMKTHIEGVSFPKNKDD